ncbi:MAG: pilus assembly protein PilM, partial [Spirochaetota bacterium]
IDIGTSSIKMVLAKKGLRDFQITDLMIETIDYSADNADDAVRDALSRLIGQNSIKGYHVLTNLPMEKAIIRNISFPFTDHAMIAEAVPFEAQENIPFNIDVLDMDFQMLHSPVDTEGRVLVAATHSDTVFEYLKFLNEAGIKPISMGLESNALFACYSYFAYAGDENIIQIDIGHNKTIINIIRDNKLLFTRCVTIGTGLIVKVFEDTMNLPVAEAQTMMEGLRLDIHDFDSNLKKNNYKTYGISKQKLKTIHTKCADIVHDLIEQVNLSLKSFAVDFGTIDFTRILYSGGGSNVIGLGALLQKEIGVPALQSEFPIAFGMVLSYFTKKKDSINFLKGDFLPDYVSESKKQYVFAAGISALALVIFLINLIVTTLFQTINSSHYNTILENQFSRYFQNRTLEGDPIDAAENIVRAEKKELDNLKTIIPTDTTILEALQNVTARFQDDPNFQLRNLVIDSQFIRFDGDTDSGTKID